MTAELIALGLLLAVLAFAMTQPCGLPEATVAVPAAGFVVGLGIVSPAEALAQVRALGPTVGFLAIVLVLARTADTEGTFRWLGDRLASASAGRARRLLVVVFAAAAITTAVLSLDATVVLLTPVVSATATQLRLRPKPHVYACAHLANSASTLLPVSNLTNLLALRACGLSFLGFAAFMTGPWLVSLAVEFLVFRRFFATDLSSCAQPSGPASTGTPRFALTVLALTLAGFAASSFTGIPLIAVALAGTALLAGKALAHRRLTPWQLFKAAAPLFGLFVLTLGVVVAGVSAHGLGAALGAVLPRAPTLPGLLAVAGLAAALCNVVNNLPATLVLLGALGPAPHPGLVLAALLGVNIGPNLTYVGSLATLLWRRALAGEDTAPTTPQEFLRLGARTVPACLAVATVALWLAVTVGRGWLP